MRRFFDFLLETLGRLRPAVIVAIAALLVALIVLASYAIPVDKQVNDRFGHETGDRVLVATARAIRKSLRVNDIVARLGGDEFVVLLPQTELRDAEVVLRKLEAKLAEVMRQGRWPVTASIGAATFKKPPASVEQMVELVDVLMYSAKSKGKGRLERRVVGA